jgi:anti-sigma B factor antagonist
MPAVSYVSLSTGIKRVIIRDCLLISVQESAKIAEKYKEGIEFNNNITTRLDLPGVSTNMANEVAIETTMETNVGVVAFKSPSITDVQGIADAGDEIKEFVGAERPHTLVFDFEQVKFFSSQVLGLLLDIRAKLAAYDGTVVISAINPQLHRVFRITNLDKVFGFFPDRESAVKSAGAG